MTVVGVETPPFNRHEHHHEHHTGGSPDPLLPTNTQKRIIGSPEVPPEPDFDLDDAFLSPLVLELKMRGLESTDSLDKVTEMSMG